MKHDAERPVDQYLVPPDSKAWLAEGASQMVGNERAAVELAYLRVDKAV